MYCWFIMNGMKAYLSICIYHVKVHLNHFFLKNRRKKPGYLYSNQKHRNTSNLQFWEGCLSTAINLSELLKLLKFVDLISSWQYKTNVGKWSIEL